MLDNWLTLPSEEYCDSVRDGTHDSPKFHESGYPLITSKAIKDGRLLFDNAGLISETDYSEINKRSKVEQWDILFTMIGTLGEVYLETSEDVDYAIKNVGLFKCGEELKAKWLYYWFRSSINKSSILQLRRGASQQYLPLGTLRNLNITYPSDSQIIVKTIDVLSSYDDLIENNRRRIQLLEESARLLYKEWFVRLRFPGHEHIKITDGVPEGWESGTVIDFYKTTSGGTPSRKNMDFYTGDINWVKTGELVDSFIFTTEEKITEEAIARSSAKIFPIGSVLVAMYGATIGRTGILAEPSASNQACCALIPNNDLANTIHAYLFLRENKAGLINLAKGAAQNNISQNIIKSYPMVMPPIFLMEIFHSSLEENFEQLKILQKQNVKLIEARDILLPRLMNGELTV